MTITMIASGLFLGLLAGVAAGLFGIGGGLIVVPVLVLAYGFDQKTATGTSLFAIMWPVGILGVFEYYKRGEMQIGMGALIAVGMLFGTLAGAKMVVGISQTNMQKLYGCFLLLGGTWMIAKPYIMPSSKPVSTTIESVPSEPVKR
jgi:uncharacterized membrane protein YfcA